MGLLELCNICKSYKGTTVLDGASLSCNEGAVTCLVGANAAGKTTLLTIAAGLQKADSGEITFDGRLGFLPQETALLEGLTVAENLQLWYAAADLPRGHMFADGTVETTLELAPFANKRIELLSGGIRKRVAIACALVSDPACLLLDEPFTALDVNSRNHILTLLRQLAQRGKVILFSSHDPAAIAAVADCVAVLRNGTIAKAIPIVRDDGLPTEQVLQLLAQV